VKTDTLHLQLSGAPPHSGTELPIPPRLGGPRQWMSLVMGTLFLLLPGAGESSAGVVNESATEFLTSGDFNGDGILDVLVLDKATGNARVGYQDANGVLVWSAPLITGAENATGCGIGKFLQPDRAAVAVTSPELNQVYLADLSNSNSAGPSVAISLPGLGPHSLTGLNQPFGGAGSAFDNLLTASSFNDGPSERLDMTGFLQGVPSIDGQFNESGSFARPNALRFGTNTFDFAIGLVRGTNDTLHVWQFTNAPGLLAAYSNLPPLSDYAFGIFNGEALPRFAFYVPGQSNISIVPLTNVSGLLNFGTAIPVSLPTAIAGLYYVDGTNGDGSFQVLFGDGVQGIRVPGDSPTLGTVYRHGAGSTGLIPLTSNQFALLTAPTGRLDSVHAQVMQFNAGNYTQISASDLPAITSHATRANVWLFQREPFVSSEPGFISSLSSPDWSTRVSGLPATLSVRTESDGGTGSGLGSAGTNNLGAPPPGTVYGVPDQYADSISLFSYATPRGADSVTVTISPPPGMYPGPVQVSFSTLNLSDTIFYRTGPTDQWRQFASAFSLTNDTTVQYYGTNASAGVRSRLLSATYQLASNSKGPEPPLIVDPGAGTNTLPVFNTNQVTISESGTIFYSRRSGSSGTVWSIDLTGAGDHYITSGIRPRVSRDGKWMAFLREGTPFTGGGNLWTRNLATGSEQRLLINTNTIVGYDWDLTGTNLVIDYGCKLWYLSLSGTLSPMPLSEGCADVAPVVNPLDGRLAYFNANANAFNPGISVTTPDLATGSRLNLNVPGASWPSWSPDGQSILFVGGNDLNAIDQGTNLYLVLADGTGLYQVTGFAAPPDGFPHGAIWSPVGDVLVGAGTVTGTNGLYVIPLDDGCACMALRLPTTAGDPIDFAGSIAVAAAPPPALGKVGLFIRVDPDDLVVYWSTNFVGYVLETSGNVPPPSSWSTVNGPYLQYGFFYEYRIPRTNLLDRQFFRLRPSNLVVNSPTLSVLVQSNEMVINWPTNTTGFVLESKTNLSEAIPWTTISGPFTISGNMFEIRKTSPAQQSQEFFRLHHP
jgi:Tol biopolymer transport system component